MGTCCSTTGQRPSSTSYGIFHYDIPVSSAGGSNTLQAGSVQVRFILGEIKSGESSRPRLSVFRDDKTVQVTARIRNNKTSARVQIYPDCKFSSSSWADLHETYGPTLKITVEVRQNAPDPDPIITPFIDFYTRQKFTDCSIHTADGIIGAHRLMLCKQCVILNQTDEKDLESIDLKDQKAITVARFLHLCYYGDHSNFEKLQFIELLEILALCDRFDAPLVSAICLTKIEKNLTLQTLPQLMGFAQHLSAVHTRMINDICSAHIRKNPDHAIAMLASQPAPAISGIAVTAPLTKAIPGIAASAPPDYAESTQI